MLTVAGLVAGCLAGLWLLTWMARIAAYAMFAAAFMGWWTVRLLAGAARRLRTVSTDRRTPSHRTPRAQSKGSKESNGRDVRFGVMRAS